MGLGRHRALVSPAAGGRRPGGAVPRPAAVPRACWPGARRRRRPARRRRARPTGTGSARRPPRAADLFAADDTAEHLRADVEDARQLAAVAASPEAARLGLLVAAESAGALVAAEMTHVGVPWRVDVHERAAHRAARPAPAARRAPAAARRSASTRSAASSTPPASTPTPAPTCSAPCGARASRSPTSAPRRCAPSTTRSSSRCCATRSSPTSSRPTAGRGSTSGCSDGRFRPSYQPAGSATGRWSSNGGGALSFPVQVRSAAVADEGWVLVVADVAQLEPRVLAGMSGDRALARAARGADLYQGMVDDGAVATRQDAKLGLLGAMYGATSGESGRMVAGLTRRYPAAVRPRRGGGAGRRARPGRPHPARARQPRPGRHRGTSRPTRPRPTSTPRTGGAGPTAGSPATSSCRAPAPSGRCAGSPTCATGCGDSAATVPRRPPAPGPLPPRRGRGAHPCGARRRGRRRA